MGSKTLKRRLASLGLTLAFCSAYFVPVYAATTTIPSTLTFTTENNKAGAADTLSTPGTGLVTGDIVKVYSSSTATTATTSAAVTTTGQAITFSQADLLTATAKAVGNVYVTVTGVGKTESTKKTIAFKSDQSSALLASAITVKNNEKGDTDTIDVTGLASGDVITVYSSSTTTTAITSGTSTGSALQLSGTDLLGAKAGSVHVSITKTNKTESTRLAKSYLAEPVTTALPASAVKTLNNKTGATDYINVTSSTLANGDIVKVYETTTSTAVLATATSTGSALQLSGVDILKSAAGKVYVTVTKADKNESIRTAVTYLSDVSKAVTSANVKTYNNNSGATDYIDVFGLSTGDIVNIYATSTSTAILATATSTGAGVRVSGVNLMGAAAGKIFVGVVRGSQVESTHITPITYKAEPVTTTPKATNITVLNDEGTGNDIVRVRGLSEGYVVKVYSSSTSGAIVLGTGTVATGKTAVNVSLTLPTITAPATTGKVYVTVTSTTANESKTTAASYIAE